ncbi:hypothetical protein D3877_08600 [Azospirillum cavernae]|uniref:Trypsin-co-occurring domain-containing protein n=1 Tax=Azospirillum cavernae TaxID=2320860 RepID=A0A418W3F5_9PROT|nr:trypco2 family protein [Azospirillum cavernae]RJF84565.1 hypothetical protein D3877_08600 [Azospirillum cavernae]
MAKIGLAHAIKSLRAELAEAITQGDGEDLRFKVEAIDLELAVACEVGSNGDLSFQVLGLGGKLGGKVGGTTTHRVKLSLKVADRAGALSDTFVSNDVDRCPE